MTTMKRLLLVDDNSADAELARLAFEAAGLTSYDVVDSGREALDYLFRTGRYAARVTGQPSLILLDLKMPGLHGLDVLRHVKGDARFAMLPVVIFTTSTKPEDIEASYREGANGYLVKPVSYDAFVQVVRGLQAFWMTHNVTITDAWSRSVWTP